MHLKRYAADAFPSEDLPIERKGREKLPPVAVVGSGPSGLACAARLVQMNYPVTVFEAEKVVGGMLALGIPSYRLPRETLKKDIRRLVRAGVKFRTGVRVGTDISLRELREKGFRAVYLAVGAWKETPLRVPGSDRAGVIGSLSFLKAWNTGSFRRNNGVYSMNTGGSAAVITGSRVAVIGGGNAAMDVARTCLRLGAREVNVVYRRSRDAMPAIREEVEEAEREGVRFHFFLSPREVEGPGGTVSGLVCVRMKPGDFDTSGRRRAVPTDETVTLPCDIVISAIGAAPDFSDPNRAHLGWTQSLTLEADPLTLATSLPGVFAGGDLVTGGGTVLDAMADGQRAAVSIDRFLRGEDLRANRYLEPGTRKTVPYPLPDEPAHEPRVPAKRLPVTRRLCSFDEVELGYSAKAAVCEAGRCLRCDRKENDSNG